MPQHETVFFSTRSMAVAGIQFEPGREAIARYECGESMGEGPGGEVRVRQIYRELSGMLFEDSSSIGCPNTKLSARALGGTGHDLLTGAPPV